MLRDLAISLLPIKLEIRKNQDLLSRLDSRFYMEEKSLSVRRNKDTGSISARGKIISPFIVVAEFLEKIGFRKITDTDSYCLYGNRNGVVLGIRDDRDESDNQITSFSLSSSALWHHL